MTTKDYKKTHLDSYRYRCRKNKKGYGFQIIKNGNYESLASFKNLPSYKDFMKNGRKWKFTKTYQPIMDRFILDVDCDNDLEKAFHVTQQLMQDLSDYLDCINVYFSGSKGFHIEILTDELDIVNLTADKPGESCPKYEEFLNYFHSKYDEVDTSLKDVGVRVLRIHHTKHEKTGNYKILVDVNASLDKILTSSKANKDMVEPKTAFLDKEQALSLLTTFNKPVTDKPTKLHKQTKKNKLAKTVQEKINFDDSDFDFEAEYVDYSKVDMSIFTTVFNELNTNRHDRIGLIGAGLNGYVNYEEMEQIYNELAKTTDIESSDNAKQSFIDAYENDQMPQNLGQIRNHYVDNELDLSNFDKLSHYLKSKQHKKGYDKFNNIFESYNYDWFTMFETELFDYVDNTANIFNAVIHSLSALLGYKKASRLVAVNGGAEVGKSELIKTLEKLMPYFMDLGSSTPATVRRRSKYYFDKKIVYLGDKGLRGESQNAKDEWQGLYEVFGGMVSDHKFKKDVVGGGDKILEFDFKTDGICVFYTEPYTDLRKFGAGDQYTSRTTFITVNPVEDGLALFLQDEEKTNPFYEIHKNYIQHILENPIKITLSKEVKTALYQASRDSQRTAKYLRDLFKGYCQYMQIGYPLTADVEAFLKVFKPKSEVTAIEYLIYTKLYKNLNVITTDELDYLIYEDGGVQYEDMLLQTKDRKSRTFFTAKQIKTYFKNDFKRNKNLKDTTDQIPNILKNLYDAGYLDKLGWQYSNQNVYYITKNKEMEK